MAKFYFTYGTEGHPFFGGWTEIETENEESACMAFRAFHPDKEAGFLNCSFVYGEERFKNTSMYTNGNFGYRCHEKIALQRELLTTKGA